MDASHSLWYATETAKDQRGSPLDTMGEIISSL